MAVRRITPDDAVHMAKYCASINLRNAARAATRHYDRSLRAVGITATQLPLLAAIRTGSNASIVTLAQTLDLERSTISRELDVLVRQGLVQRETGDDRRATSLALTPKGHSVLAKAFAAWNAAHEEIVAAFGEKELQELLKRVRRLERTLGGVVESRTRIQTTEARRGSR